MAKSKQRNHRPDEFLREQIRHLKKEIRRKDQRIRYLEKELGYQNKTEFVSLKKEPPKCPECAKGDMSLVDIGIRLYAVCSLCKYRERVS